MNRLSSTSFGSLALTRELWPPWRVWFESAFFGGGEGGGGGCELLPRLLTTSCSHLPQHCASQYSELLETTEAPK